MLLMRLVHISDLHYTTARKAGISRLLERVRREKPDHLAITGDLTEHGTRQELKAVSALLSEYGCSDADRLSLIPGNHDMFGFIYQKFAEGEISEHLGSPVGIVNTIRGLWQLRSELLDFYESDYVNAIQKFCSQFEYAMNGCIVPGGSGKGFPFAKLLGHDLALIGIDTNHYVPVLYNNPIAYAKAIATLDPNQLGENLTGSTGWTDKKLLNNLLRKPRVVTRRKIFLMHHYLYTRSTVAKYVSDSWAEHMRLYNRDSISKSIKEIGAEVVLHGHWHINDEYKLSDGTPVLNGGGAYYGSYNVIDIGSRTLRSRVVGS